MRSRLSRAAVPSLLLLLSTCAFPSEQGAGFTVVMDSLPQVLIRGRSYYVTGRVLDERGGVMPGAAVAFALAGMQLAMFAQAAGPAAVQLFAESQGPPASGVLVARAQDFPDAVPDSEAFDVRDFFVDSVTPLTVRFGDTLNVFGGGLNPFSRPVAGPLSYGHEPSEVTLNLRSFTSQLPEFTLRIADYQELDRVPNQYGVLSGIVPVGVPDSAEVVVLPIVTGIIPTPPSPSFVLHVVQEDILEPNDTVPREIAVPFSALLAFEASGASGPANPAADWYTFTVSVTDTVAVFVRADETSDQWSIMVADSVAWGGTPGTFILAGGSWAVGSIQGCHGTTVDVARRPRRERDLILALPPGGYHVVATRAPPDPGRAVLASGYGLSLYQFLAGVDQASRDPEENDYCDVATPFFAGSGQLGTAPVAHSGNFDSSDDVDWYRFSVPAGPQYQIRFSVAADGAPTDPDLLLVRDEAPDSVAVVARGQGAGVRDSVEATVAGGNYFVAVFDFEGTLADYTLTFQPLSAGAGRRSVAPGRR
ncbi:MAG: PPC domain-containing protein [Gemmatimonadales bacterium]